MPKHPRQVVNPMDMKEVFDAKAPPPTFEPTFEKNSGVPPTFEKNSRVPRVPPTFETFAKNPELPYNPNNP